MVERSAGYKLASHVHGSLIGQKEILSNAELGESGVSLDFGRNALNTTERLFIRGIIDGRPAYQTLAKDKNGTFHLSTVFTEYGGAHIQHDIRPDSKPDSLDPIVDSLFMSALVRIANTRD